MKKTFSYKFALSTEIFFCVRASKLEIAVVIMFYVKIFFYKELLIVLKNFLTQEFGMNVLFDEPMKKHTSFRIGGNADILFLPKNKFDIVKMISFCEKNEIEYFIVGNGTNLLVSDSGFRGAVIKINKNMSTVKIDHERMVIEAESGILLSTLSRMALENNFSGLEFASGIPGSFGGAICMNAGAYGSEIKDIFLEAEVLYKNKIQVIQDLKFGYRKSLIDNNYIILSAKIKLKNGIYSEIKNKMDEYKTKRQISQPLNFFNAGSIFKRPKNNFAGKLIMEAGLSGYKIGDACISEKHCGFIVNLGNATAKNVFDLILYIKKIVHERFNIKLEEEIRFLGEF